MLSMTPKQAKFVAEYLVDGNGSRAAIAAGYGRAGARVAACRALANANVRAAIAARQGVDARRLEIERQDVIQGLLEGVAAAKSQANPAAMIAGWREIGKMLGFYAPEVQRISLAPVTDVALERLEKLTDQELLALIGEKQQLLD